MEITFQAGETKWGSDGKHILDSLGIAEVYEVETTVVFDSQAIFDQVTALLAEQAARNAGSVVQGE